MDLTNFSLIYPSEKSRNDHYSGKNIPDIDMYTLDQLGMLEILDLKNSELSEYFTDDPEVMKYRFETFNDMLANESLVQTLNKLMPILTDITELRQLEADSGDSEDYLSSITEIELYISCIETLSKGLQDAGDSIKGRAFSVLRDRISELVSSDYYAELNKKLEELTKRVREIKSITVGVNLDSQLRPSSAGVLSINSESFKSGDVLDKILRLNF